MQSTTAIQPDCLEVVTVEPPAPEIAVDRPAYLFVGVLLVAVLIFELWALQSHHHTISQTIQKLAGKFHWIRAVGVVGLFFLGWHLLWGGPL